MKNIVPFNFENKQVRVVVDEHGDPWFNANDVCAALNYGNPRDAISAHVDQEDVGKRDTLSAGGKQQSNHVNESGLYALIFGSTKKESKSFKKWVTSEVLPTIRKTGSYQMPNIFKATPNPTLVDTLFFAQAAAVFLRVSEAGKILMLQKVAAGYDLPNMLPNYSDETITSSLSTLLKEHGSVLSAVKVNLILLDLGVLEEKSRPDSKGGTKRFKCLTESGLKYGKNVISPQNQRETQPHYYAATFPELLDQVNAWMCEEAA